MACQQYVFVPLDLFHFVESQKVTTEIADSDGSLPDCRSEKHMTSGEIMHAMSLNVGFTMQLYN